MTTLLDSDWPTLVGHQEPLHLLVDEGNPVEAEKACTLAARVGKQQMPWQRDTLHGVLALNDDGLFTHPTAILVVPRQNGKTLSAAELRILYGAFNRHETIVYSAQRWITAKAIYLRVKRLIASRPSLKRRASGWLCSQGVAGFTVHHDDGTESQVMFITRSADFRGPDEIDLVIYDEAYNLTDASMSAISPTQLASKNPQTIYLSSAVNEEIHANGEVLARLRARSLESIRLGRSRTGVYYAEFAAPEPSPDLNAAERKALREDPQTWRMANPSMGVIHSDAKVQKLLSELSAESFEVEVLGWGRWPRTEGEEASPIPRDVWNPMANPTARLTGSRTIAIHRSRNRKVWTIAAAQMTTDGRIHPEIGPRRTGTHTEIAEYLIQKVTEWNPVALLIDRKNTANVLEPLLVAAGIEPVMTGAPEAAASCEVFLNDALAGKLSHSDQAIFNDSVASGSLRELPGKDVAWAEDEAGVAGPLVAASLAVWGLRKYGTQLKRKTVTPRTGAKRTISRSDQPRNRRKSSDFDAMTAAF